VQFASEISCALRVSTVTNFSARYYRATLP
jgi:hypothetical protein